MKKIYIIPSVRSSRLRTASPLAGSAAAPQQQSMKWRTDESIDPNGEALARQRGDSSLRLPANTFVQ